MFSSTPQGEDGHDNQAENYFHAWSVLPLEQALNC
jgi:hypothetical protein